ncbi:MFS transporter [uncultured Paludibaculum sp.]|uniref:MFS transporter n=1 Tax=uncultured Paludibaculum sp. TaxID=1765020 RepID=UPI002AAAAD0C|nr:MFS transporter [uncultured Paludibaculum sp.]
MKSPPPPSVPSAAVGEQARIPDAPDPGRWRSLAVILAAAFLVGLDFFVVNVSIPSIRASLHATFAEVQLVIASYGLTYAVLLISGGRLGDIYGRKRMFMWGVVAFTLASLLCGLAPSPIFLIAARAIQGVSGAMLFPQVLSIMQITFPQNERAKAFGLFGTVIGTSSFSGNVLGGLLVSADLFGLSWRPIFLINLPIGLLTVLAAARVLKETRSPKARRLDLVGVALMTLALTLLLYPLIQGREAGWPLWAFVCLAAFLPVMAVFVRYEQRVTAGGGSPLVELSLFHDPAFVTGLFSGVCFFSGAAAFFLIFTIFLQNGIGYSPRDAGLTFAWFAIAFLGSSLASVRVQPRLGSRIINLGAALMITGLSSLLWLTASRGPALAGLDLAPILLVYGTGQGFVMPTLISTILINIKGHDAGSASGVLSTVQQVSFATGVAVIGTVFFSALGKSTSVDAFIHALRVAFTVNICLLTVTFLLMLRIPRFPAREIPR